MNCAKNDREVALADVTTATSVKVARHGGKTADAGMRACAYSIRETIQKVITITLQELSCGLKKIGMKKKFRENPLLTTKGFST